jgi:hypothetical protein
MTADVAPDQILARVQSYDDLLAACRQRVKALGVNYTIIDDLAGYGTGYLAKLLLHTDRNASGKRRTRRGFTPQSLDAYLAALGLDLVAVENPERVARLRAWQETNSLRRGAPVRADGMKPDVTFRLSHHFIKRIAQLGGEARARKLHARAERRERMRTLALMRWAKRSATACPLA